MNLVTVKAPYGVTWAMAADAWGRLQARLPEKAHRYQATLSVPLEDRTGTAEETS
jgi:YD repeat-containing protein